MTITHNGKQYTVSKLGTGYTWQLTEVGNPRHKITLNHQQMVLAGLSHGIEKRSTIDQYHLKAAQGKAAIARMVGDGDMWMSAYSDIKTAIGYPWHRRGI